MSTNQYEKRWNEVRYQAELEGLQIIEHGWEQHVIIDKDQGLVYRYPRHAAAAAKLEDEVAVLHNIHHHEWPVDLPKMVDHNDVFSTYTYIPGNVLTPGCVAKLEVEDFIRIGHSLGEFMAQFHRLDPSIVEQKRTRHHTTLLDYYADRISNPLARHDFHHIASTALEALIASVDGNTTDVVVHGDLHGPNIVINPMLRELRGVIDLSEMEIGDPHQEFRKIFMTFPAALDATLASYEASGGQVINKETVILWAYVNEWANLCYFADTPDNPTYQRAYAHLAQWGQLQ